MSTPYVLIIRTVSDADGCTERTIRQLLLTVRNSAAVLDSEVLLSSFHLNCHAHFRISSTNLDIYKLAYRKVKNASFQVSKEKHSLS